MPHCNGEPVEAPCRGSDNAADGLHIHIPTPGDHYSAATGSAVITVIYEMTRQHACAGGRTSIVVGRGTRHDYEIGECAEVDFTVPPDRRRKLLDAISGRLGLPRYFGRAVYHPASQTIPRELDAPIFIHNDPVAITMFKRMHPAARVCLWAHNELFRSYTNGEAQRVVASADRLICCSRYIAKEMASHLPGSSGKIRVVHNGVNIEQFRPAPKSTDGGPIILFLGRVQPNKGPHLLLRAAALLKDLGRRFSVRIVGSSGFSATDPLTSYEQELRRLSVPLGGTVEFQPFVDRHEVMGEYAAASIFCVPSDWEEPFGLTVLEGMACGLPTIASSRGGIPEAGGDAILYFDPPKVDQLAQRLAYLLDDSKARVEWGSRARARAETMSWANQYRTLRQALED